MYLEHYGLAEHPFSLSPNPEFFYPSAAHRTALDHLVYGLGQSLGFILLSGEIGSGKTTLLRRVSAQLGEDTEVALVFNTNVTPRELLKLVLQEFELDASGDKAELLDRLNGFLINRFARGGRTVLVIDEAQNLSVEALEEVRMLSNLQTETTPLLQIVLAGQPELAVKMRDGELRQLAQRVTVSYHLPPLNLDETREYVAHRLRTAGREQADLFEPAALKLVYAESGGIPRIINNLCDAALLAGYADGVPTIGAAILREVVEERQRSGCPVGRVLAARSGPLAQGMPAAAAETTVQAPPVSQAAPAAEPVPTAAPEAPIVPEPVQEKPPVAPAAAAAAQQSAPASAQPAASPESAPSPKPAPGPEPVSAAAKEEKAPSTVRREPAIAASSGAAFAGLSVLAGFCRQAWAMVSRALGRP